MASNDERDILCFPSYRDAYTGATAIGVSGVYSGRRLTLGGRVITGSWRHADGTRTFKYSRWVTFHRTVIVEDGNEHVLFSRTMEEMALVPESAYMTLALTVVEQKARVA